MAKIKLDVDVDLHMKEFEAATERGIRRRGFGGEAFDGAMQRAKAEVDNPTQHPQVTVASHGEDPREDDESIDRTTDSGDPGDRRAHEKKPVGQAWVNIPKDAAEWAIYNGLHLHTPDNPLGLHTHMIGGPLGGGHSHGPQNLMGAHHHRDIDVNPDPQKQDPPGIVIDGHHNHASRDNMPSGPHKHETENFG